MAENDVTRDVRTVEGRRRGSETMPEPRSSTRSALAECTDSLTRTSKLSSRSDSRPRRDRPVHHGEPTGAEASPEPAARTCATGLCGGQRRGLRTPPATSAPRRTASVRARATVSYPPGHLRRVRLRRLPQDLGATSVGVTFDSRGGRYLPLGYGTEPMRRRLAEQATQEPKAFATAQIRQALPRASNQETVSAGIAHGPCRRIAAG